jgi:hypothetical protein
MRLAILIFASNFVLGNEDYNFENQSYYEKLRDGNGASGPGMSSFAVGFYPGAGSNNLTWNSIGNFIDDAGHSISHSITRKACASTRRRLAQNINRQITRHNSAIKKGATVANPNGATEYDLIASDSFNCTTWSISTFNNLTPTAPIVGGSIEPYNLAQSTGNNVQPYVAGH